MTLPTWPVELSAEQRKAYAIDDAPWELIPTHMQGAVYRYVMAGAPIGDFLGSLLENDFMEAAGRADDDNLASLAGWARFLYNGMPGGSFRTKERVQAWQISGGILGQRAAKAAGQ